MTQTLKDFIDANYAKELLEKWKGQPHDGYMKDKAVHWTKILLPGDREFFFEMVKTKDEVREKLFQDKPEAADRYHGLWEKLRDNGWRRLKDRDGNYHWACMYPHLIRKKTERIFSEVDQARWESEYYGEEFVKEDEA